MELAKIELSGDYKDNKQVARMLHLPLQNYGSHSHFLCREPTQLSIPLKIIREFLVALEIVTGYFFGLPDIVLKL